MKQISIIGLSRAGKTCYMYAMAKTMKRGVNGITIFAPDDNLRDQLDMGWRKIRREGRWPSGSDKVTRCNFNCMLNLRSVLDFCWDDFKGGTLNSFNEIDRKFRTEFYRYLQDSDGMIFFIAADMVKRIMNEEEDSDYDWDDLEKLNEIFSKIGEKLKKIPITIAITKSDLLDNKVKPALFEMIRELFPPLFEVNNQIKTLIVPVSLGENLGNGEQNQPVSGTIFADPKEGNIHLPIMFNLYHYLKEYISETRDEIASLKKDLSNKSSSINVANNHGGLWRWWNGYDLDDLQSDKRKLEAELRDTESTLSQYERDLEQVRREFTKDCQYFVNGVLQKL